MNVANSNALKTHLSRSDDTATNRPGTQTMNGDGYCLNRQITPSAPQNSFLSPVSELADQICSTGPNALKTHLSRSDGTFTNHASPARLHPQSAPRNPATFSYPKTSRIPPNSPLQTHVQTNASLTPKSTATATCSRIQSRHCNRTISAAAVFDSVSCRVLLSCRWPPHLSHCVVSEANNQ